MLLELGSAILGIFGGISTAVAKYKMKKLDCEHDIAMAEQDRLMIQAEADKAVKITETEVRGAVEIAEIESYKISQTVGNKSLFKSSYLDKMYEVDGWPRYLAHPIAFVLTTLFALVDVFRGVMRPALTAYYAGASLLLTYESYKLLQASGSALTPAMASAILTSSINTIMCLSITCVTWWFADRRMGKFLMEKQNA